MGEIPDFGDLEGFAELLAELDLTDDLGPDNGFGPNPRKKKKDSGNRETVTRVVYDHRPPGELITEQMAYRARLEAAAHLFDNHPYKIPGMTYAQLSDKAKLKWLVTLRDAIAIYNRVLGRNL